MCYEHVCESGQGFFLPIEVDWEGFGSSLTKLRSYASATVDGFVDINYPRSGCKSICVLALPWSLRSVNCFYLILFFFVHICLVKLIQCVFNLDWSILSFVCLVMTCQFITYFKSSALRRAGEAFRFGSLENNDD